MKKNTFILLLFFSPLTHAQTNRELDNIAAFNKLFGYVRYFHPSDEASEIDWNKFAIYGSGEARSCKDAAELQQTLIELFEPIAPTVKVVRKGKGEKFSIKSITPPDTTGYKVITWQHSGLGDGNLKNVYQSGRINRSMPAAGPPFSTITTYVDAAKYQGKSFVLSASVRLAQGPGSAHLWARVDRPDKKMGFFNNMDDRPIKSDSWNVYEIKGTIAMDAQNLYFGCFLKGKGKLFVDNLVLRVNEDNEWKTVYENSFESDKTGAFPSNMSGGPREPDYKLNTTEEEASEGKQSVSIASTDHLVAYNALFAKHCQPGEYVSKDLGAGLSAIVPLALYGTQTQTWPAADERKLSALKQHLQNITADPAADLNVRIGGIVSAWNVFQHFYPYFEVARTNWEDDFRTAIKETFANQSYEDYLTTLRRLTARLKDGHVRVYGAKSMASEGYAPPIRWEWIEDKLVITMVGSEDLALKPGDVVTAIDDKPARQLFDEIYPTISAATPGWLHARANTSALLGPLNSTLTLVVVDDQGHKKKVTVTRSLTTRAFYDMKTDDGPPIRTLMDDICYVDIRRASMKQISDRFDELKKAKAIICDLRGYPNQNHQIISHFLQSPDTSKRWMRVPQIIYPDQEHITGYRDLGWQLPVKDPHLGAKVYFLLDGSAISYAESFMSFIEHYDLATIVGQPSAGTNGNVNRIELPGGFSISWTGMKVFKHDGSLLHGVGVLPDVYVTKTIKGVRENRDEFLDKATELASAYVRQKW